MILKLLYFVILQFNALRFKSEFREFGTALYLSRHDNIIQSHQFPNG